jgi:hypothetical protein
LFGFSQNRITELSDFVLGTQPLPNCRSQQQPPGDLASALTSDGAKNQAADNLAHTWVLQLLGVPLARFRRSGLVRFLFLNIQIGLRFRRQILNVFFDAGSNALNVAPRQQTTFDRSAHRRASLLAEQRRCDGESQPGCRSPEEHPLAAMRILLSIIRGFNPGRLAGILLQSCFYLVRDCINALFAKNCFVFSVPICLLPSYLAFIRFRFRFPSFVRMRQRIQHQICNVPVHQAVENVLPLAAPHHYVFRAQNPEPLRNSRHCLVLCLSEVTDTTTPIDKAAQQPQSR